MNKQIILHDSDNAAVQHGTAAMQFTMNGKLVTQWNIDDVTMWLTSIGLNGVVRNFQEHSITGSVLHRINDDYLQGSYNKKN